MQLPIYLYFVIISVIAGIFVYFQHGMPLYLKLLPLFLLVSIFVEVLALWLAIHRGTNTALFNFYSTFELTFYLYVLREIIVRPFVRKILAYVLVVYPLFAFINIIYIQKLNNWHSVSYSIGNLLVVAFAIYYFFELFKIPKAINLVREPGFWICSGLLFFYSCSFPFLGPANFVLNMPVVILNNLVTILTLLNALLYSVFTIAFLCKIKIRFKTRKPAL